MFEGIAIGDSGGEITPLTKQWFGAWFGIAGVLMGAFAIGLVGAALGITSAAEVPPKTFFTQHCTECHDGDAKKGGLDLTALQPDLAIGHHDASHHGKDPAKIEQLARYEEKEYRNFAGFLDQLVAADENGRPLLARTQILFVSNLGDASAHSSDNLPVIIAGGGYQHPGHLAFDRQQNTPLANLFVRMLQHAGIEAARFGSSTGALSELKSAA